MTTALDTSTKFTALQAITWPVFKLSEKEPNRKDGLVFFYTEYVDDSNDTNLTYKIVDDSNLPQKTLGLRRLALQKDPKIKLHKISTAVYFLADLIKLAKANTWFIDSAGKIFQWKKYTRAKLTTKKIKQVLPADGIGCVLEVVGLSQRFKSLQRPQDYHQYAVFLVINQMHILYGLSDVARKDSWRLV
jgi:hypothetical protein